MAARQKNGIIVSRVPVRCSKFAFSRCRMAMTRDRSTSKTLCTCALVRFDCTMRSAIFLRIADIGITAPGMAIGCCDGIAGAAAPG